MFNALARNQSLIRMNCKIRSPRDRAELELCAHVMATSEPWLTLQRTYEKSLALLSNAAKEVYLAEHENEITGFLILDMNGAFKGYLQTICVMPNWRGRGVGTQLIAFAEEKIFREAPNVFLCVSSFNPAAQKLYLRLGYEVVGVLKDYVVTGHDEILLRKTIAPLEEFQARL